MVRLQKIAYQKIVNSKILGRARVLATPRKWHYANPNQQSNLKAHYFTRSLIGKILSPIFNWIVQFELRWQRDIFLQQGLSFEDRFLHTDAQLRRDVLFEHFARQNLHPYHTLLKNKRRQRYFKVQKAVRGFFVPSHIRAQAQKQSLSTALQLQRQWTNFTHQNYFSDMTPSIRHSVLPKWIPLQWPLIYNIMNPEAWDRYFYNEVNYQYYPEQMLKVVRDPKKFPFDLTKSEGKSEFQNYIKKFVSTNPGILIPEGQQFNFTEYYKKIGV